MNKKKEHPGKDANIKKGMQKSNILNHFKDHNVPPFFNTSKLF